MVAIGLQEAMLMLIASSMAASRSGIRENEMHSEKSADEGGGGDHLDDLVDDLHPADADPPVLLYCCA